MADTQNMWEAIEQEIQPAQPGRRGPPNRMNDLPYREWMKFQKSFFRYGSDQALAEECITFFTKAMWPDGTSSRSLIVGFDAFDRGRVPGSRSVEICNHLRSMTDLLNLLEAKADSGNSYDFVLIDLRHHVFDPSSLRRFLNEFSAAFFRALKQLLVRERYCGVLVATEESGGGGFPLPWSVALSCREHLRLRDERVGLVEDTETLVYCLFMQAIEDKRPAATLLPEKIGMAQRRKVHIPAWTIPRPPPRKRKEILHPAKYPETLVSQFIELFTAPGDMVFDPMAGTGSSLVAALRSNRNALGVDLVQDFVDIANDRIAQETQSMLFAELQSSCSARVILGDSTELDELPELRNVKIDYAVTSPPYWSMLTNPGSENQEARRQKSLRLSYSENEHDLGNVQDYDRFLVLLERVYDQVAGKLTDSGYLTVVVKNVKREHILYPLAWDLVARLCGPDGKYDYAGTTLWCQDDVGIKPFAVGIHWVSNILHHYCLHFTKRA